MPTPEKILIYPDAGVFYAACAMEIGLGPAPTAPIRLPGDACLMRFVTARFDYDLSLGVAAEVTHPLRDQVRQACRYRLIGFTGARRQPELAAERAVQGRQPSDLLDTLDRHARIALVRWARSLALGEDPVALSAGVRGDDVLEGCECWFLVYPCPPDHPLALAP